MNQQHRYHVALRRLQDWHADSTKAVSLEGFTTSGKPGHRILRVQRYPGEASVRHSWSQARDDGERELVIQGLEAEWAEIFKAPQRDAVPTFHGRVEYRRRIAATPGSTREVAAAYGVSQSTVSRARRELQCD